MTSGPVMTRTAPVGDIELSYQLRGDGPPLLLLHGFTGCGDDFVHFFDVDALALDYQLVVPDLRGHGRTTSIGAGFSHRQCAVDMLALLDLLGIDRCRAIGLSLGGNTLLHLATLRPDRVDAMVCVSATSHFPDEARAIMRAMTDESRTDEEWAVMRQRHRGGDEQIRTLWRIARGWADSRDEMAFTAADLAAITARTLVVAGDRDPLYPLSITVDLYRAIPGASLLVLPNAGHTPPLHSVASLLFDHLR